MASYQENLIDESNGVNHIELIENVISTLDQDNSAMVKRTADGGYLWKFKYGSVEVFVQLTGISNEDTITVWSSVLKLPARDELKLMRNLLELSCTSTFEARFGIIENQVVVISIRTLAELSPSEVSRIITIVATIADNNDELLQAEFGLT
ncbi:YbjN domain-containing protein [Cronbergia sp. UHCC 0137]|uniref:YbjN domain-containing protein n=1 Tax=Cronbergia sp. UHCC 0137 TaxID=3110239 RepID=UPI002B1F9882|nr:YbjN domain-containing protein [Cronbergia sp. UHCC 0137]MEA5618303.1 YbjN domain-containing protein [Cronbergia sp. UHCC 0137]